MQSHRSDSPWSPFGGKSANATRTTTKKEEGSKVFLFKEFFVAGKETFLNPTEAHRHTIDENVKILGRISQCPNGSKGANGGRCRVHWCECPLPDGLDPCCLKEWHNNKEEFKAKA